MTAGCNLFKVLSLIVLISAFILKALFLKKTSCNEVPFKLQIKLLDFDFVPKIFHH